jgi:hypothetical protein
MLMNVCGGDNLRQYEISKVEEQDFESMLVLESMKANLSLNRAQMASIMVFVMNTSGFRLHLLQWNTYHCAEFLRIHAEWEQMELFLWCFCYVIDV